MLALSPRFTLLVAMCSLATLFVPPTSVHASTLQVRRSGDTSRAKDFTMPLARGQSPAFSRSHLLVQGGDSARRLDSKSGFRNSRQRSSKEKQHKPRMNWSGPKSLIRLARVSLGHAKREDNLVQRWWHDHHKHHHHHHHHSGEPNSHVHIHEHNHRRARSYRGDDGHAASFLINDEHGNQYMVASHARRSALPSPFVFTNFKPGKSRFVRKRSLPTGSLVVTNDHGKPIGFFGVSENDASQIPRIMASADKRTTLTLSQISSTGMYKLVETASLTAASKAPLCVTAKDSSGISMKACSDKSTEGESQAFYYDPSSGIVMPTMAMVKSGSFVSTAQTPTDEANDIDIRDLNQPQSVTLVFLANATPPPNSLAASAPPSVLAAPAPPAPPNAPAPPGGAAPPTPPGAPVPPGAPGLGSLPLSPPVQPPAPGAAKTVTSTVTVTATACDTSSASAAAFYAQSSIPIDASNNSSSSTASGASFGAAATSSATITSTPNASANGSFVASTDTPSASSSPPTVLVPMMIEAISPDSSSTDSITPSLAASPTGATDANSISTNTFMVSSTTPASSNSLNPFSVASAVAASSISDSSTSSDSTLTTTPSASPLIESISTSSTDNVDPTPLALFGTDPYRVMYRADERL